METLISLGRQGRRRATLLPCTCMLMIKMFAVKSVGAHKRGQTFQSLFREAQLESFIFQLTHSPGKTKQVNGFAKFDIFPARTRAVKV